MWPEREEWEDERLRSDETSKEGGTGRGRFREGWEREEVGYEGRQVRDDVGFELCRRERACDSGLTGCKLGKEESTNRRARGQCSTTSSRQFRECRSHFNESPSHNETQILAFESGCEEFGSLNEFASLGLFDSSHVQISRSGPRSKLSLPLS